MPLAMSLIDKALEPFWPSVSSTIAYRAFREFAERNFLAMSTPGTEANRVSRTAQSGRYQLETFGIHAHAWNVAAGSTLTVTINPDTNLPNGEWAVGTFNLIDNRLRIIGGWRTGNGSVTFTFNRNTYQHPVVLITGFDFGFDAPPEGIPTPRYADYQLIQTVS